jgi:hypothetical protein
MKQGLRLALFVAGAVQANAFFPKLALAIPRGGATDPVTVTPQVDLPEEWAPGPKRALVFMDQFSEYHGGYMSRMARDVYGVACINILSDYMIGYFQKFHPELDGPNLMRIPDQQQLQGWMDALPVDIIEGVICESDSGLPDGERVAELLHISKQNGSNEARRNKYLMNEAVRKSGLAIVQQKRCTSVEEALAFAKELGVNDSPQSPQQTIHPLAISHTTTTGLLGSGRNTQLAGSNLCIVKPIRGVASEQVFLCPDLSSVERAFNQIYGNTVFGSPGRSHDTVLVQEFAYGTEYALDTVSKDGQHKVAALWRYDKRPANGASFVYHATELIEANESEVARTVCDYAMTALDALDLKWGTTHTEVILTNDGPRLVEVNCRQHNMNFAPLTMAGMGYNSLDMLLESYLGGGPIETVHAWDDYPTLPSIRAHAAMVHLVNHASGKLVGLNGEALNEIQRLESVLELEVYPSFLEMGNHISPTVDIRSDAGWVQLINDDEEAFQRDYHRILELMPTLFLTEEE